jgi:hypothetical protein
MKRSIKTRKKANTKSMANIVVEARVVVEVEVEAVEVIAEKRTRRKMTRTKKTSLMITTKRMSLMTSRRLIRISKAIDINRNKIVDWINHYFHIFFL